jgi:CRISPR/Cas system-associated exonuclease Cas4 (RecB family)
MTLQLKETSEEIDIPSGLVSYLEKRTKRNSYPAKKSRYSVTDIVGCQRKTYYKSLGIEEEELNESTIENMWDSVRGDLLHQITYAYKWREMDMEYDIILRDGKTATLAGRLDMYDWRTATIIDLKTTKFVKWQKKQGFIPRIEHALQLQCYSTMFSTIIPVKNVNLLYVDMNEMVAYNVQNRDLSDWMKNRIQELEDSISKNQIPNGDPSALCKYCRYQTRCYNSEGGIHTKPLSIPRAPI